MANSGTAPAKRPSPVTVRFSDFSGVPSVPDGDPTASPRGMAIRFHLPSGASTISVAHSYKGFPARTRKNSSLSYAPWLQAAPARSTPTALDNFLATHLRPSCSHWRPSRYLPVSQLSHSMQSMPFRFTNREGASRYGRYRIIPDGGTKPRRG